MIKSCVCMSVDSVSFAGKHTFSKSSIHSSSTHSIDISLARTESHDHHKLQRESKYLEQNKVKVLQIMKKEGGHSKNVNPQGLSFVSPLSSTVSLWERQDRRTKYGQMSEWMDGWI